MVLLRDETEEGIVILKGGEQIGPGLVQLSAGGIIKDMFAEKPIVAMILDEGVVIVSLGVVVVVVEGKWDGIAVGRVGFAVRNLRKPAGKFGHAGFQCFDFSSDRVRQEGREGADGCHGGAFVEIMREDAAHDAIVSMGEVELSLDQKVGLGHAGWDGKSDGKRQWA